MNEHSIRRIKCMSDRKSIKSKSDRKRHAEVRKGASRTTSMLRLGMQKAISSATKERLNQFMQRKQGQNFSTSYLFNQKTNRRKKGKDEVRKEVKQRNDRTVWKHVHPNDITIDNNRKAIESLIFLSEKRDRGMKGRICTSGCTQRSHILKE